MLLIHMRKSWATLVLLVAIAANACGNKSASTVATNPIGTPIAPAFNNRTARDGSLVAVDGLPVQLASVWSKKPTVVVFYRGFF